MIPESEALLMSTGLLTIPGKTHVRAARAYEKEITVELKAALARENPGRLYALQSPDKYYDKLQKFVPDYGAVQEYLGVELGTEYQLAQMAARKAMADRFPRTTIDTVLGPRPVPLSELDSCLYAVLADTIEDYLRLVHDFAAGVLTHVQVALYAEVYPDSYDHLLATMQDWLAKKEGSESDWLPPLWLSDSIKVLRQQKLGTMVRTEPVPTQTKSPGKLKLDDVIDAAKTVTDPR